MCECAGVGGDAVCCIGYYHAWSSLLLPPPLSLPLKPISAIRRLSFGIIASLFTVVLSCLIRQHKGFKLAETFLHAGFTPPPLPVVEPLNHLMLKLMIARKE